MPNLAKFLLTFATTAVILLSTCTRALHAVDKDLIPPQLPKEQRENLLRFLVQHEKPDRFIPADAKLVGSPPAGIETPTASAPGKTIKQYMVQVIPHRPVPDQEEVKQVDVYYYRPNPEQGKPGIAVRHTVNLITGNQVGPTEVLFNSHTPISREELAVAVELAREKSSAIQELYKERDKKMVQWEYLQPLITRKHEAHEPGDRVVRLVFTAVAAKDEAPPAPVRVIVNLTKGLVVPDAQ
jgi:hypothetical protein